MSDQHGMVWWTELMTRDVAAAKAYYGAVCGYSFNEMPMPDGSTYVVGNRGEVPTVGIMDMSADAQFDAMPPHWFSYIAVDDVDAAVEQTRSGGGEVMRAPFDVEGVGRIAILKDPTGAAIGMMTPAPQPG